MPIGALVGAGTSLVGGIMGSNAASAAARQQMQAAQAAQNYAINNAHEAQGYMKGNLGQQLGYLDPYINAGQGAVGTLSSLLNTPGQGLLQNWNQNFQAPTAEQARQTPGYQFAVDQSNKQMQNSAAARGGLLSGGTAKELAQYNQGFADTNYQQTYNNAFQNYLQNYGQFQQGQANQYSRLMGLTGVGQWGAGNAVNALGQASSLNAGILGGATHDVNQEINNAGAAQAEGTIGSANAWSGALSGIGKGLSNAFSLYGANGNSWFGGGPQSGGGGGNPGGEVIGGPGTALWSPQYSPSTPLYAQQASSNSGYGGR